MSITIPKKKKKRKKIGPRVTDYVARLVLD